MGQVKFLKSIPESAGWKEMESTDDITLNSFSGNGSNITNLNMSNVTSGILNKSFYDSEIAGMGLSFTGGVLNVSPNLFSGMGVDILGVFVNYDNVTIGLDSFDKLSVIKDYATLGYSTISTLAARTHTDTLSFIAGEGINLAIDEEDHSITFSSSGFDYIAGLGLVETPPYTFNIDYDAIHVWSNTQVCSGFSGEKIRIQGHVDDLDNELFVVLSHNYLVTAFINQEGLVSCTNLDISNNSILGENSSSRLTINSLVGSDILPDTSVPLNLGGYLNRWENVFVNNIIDEYDNSFSSTIFQMIPSIGTSRPTASSSVQGNIYIMRGGVGVADVVEICLKDASDNYNWVEIAVG